MPEFFFCYSCKSHLYWPQNKPHLMRIWLPEFLFDQIYLEIRTIHECSEISAVLLEDGDRALLVPTSSCWNMATGIKRNWKLKQVRCKLFGFSFFVSCLPLCWYFELVHAKIPYKNDMTFFITWRWFHREIWIDYRIPMIKTSRDIFMEWGGKFGSL